MQNNAAQMVMTGLNASELAHRLKEIPSMHVSQSGIIDVAKIKVCITTVHGCND